jgi:uncharacterized protein (TIGR00251 family)
MGCWIRIHTIPGARVERLVVEETGQVKVWINAPAIDGRANRRLIQFLSDRLGVGRSRISIVKGAGGRIKTLDIDAMDRVDVIERLRR